MKSLAVHLGKSSYQSPALFHGALLESPVAVSNDLKCNDQQWLPGSWKGSVVIPCYNEWSAIAPCGAPKSLHFEPRWPSRADSYRFACTCMHAWPSARFPTGDNSFVLQERPSLRHADALRVVYRTQPQVFFPSCTLHESLRLSVSVESYAYCREKKYTRWFFHFYVIIDIVSSSFNIL